LILFTFEFYCVTSCSLAAPVAQTFFVDEGTREMYRLDAIVTFVDAKHTIHHLDEVKPDGAENEAGNFHANLETYLV
jgi:G3E family GTPase